MCGTISENTKFGCHKVTWYHKGGSTKGDPLCENPVAASVYNTKPVHFLSMMCDNVKWLQKTRKVYNTVAKKMVPVTFHCLNINDNYNYHMKETNAADQLCGY